MTDLRCVVDWPGTMSFIRDFVVSIAAIFTASIAYKGINKWRAEESGKADFDLARRIGTALFRMRDALSNARNAFIVAGEFPPDYDPHDKVKQGDAYSHVFTGRFEPIRLAAIEILALSNEAEALWGRAIVEKLNKLLSKARALRAAMEAYVSNKYSEGRDFAQNKDFRDSITTTVFEESFGFSTQSREANKPNPFTVEIETAVDEVAAYLRTKLPRHS